LEVGVPAHPWETFHSFPRLVPKREGRGIRGWLAAVVIGLSIHHAPSRPHHRPPYPLWWKRQALCIHRHESTNWHAYDPPYANGFQFLLSTWERAGGSAATWVRASPRQQMYRAWRIWTQDGGSWREWSTAYLCI